MTKFWRTLSGVPSDMASDRVGRLNIVAETAAQANVRDCLDRHGQRYRRTFFDQTRLMSPGDALRLSLWFEQRSKYLERCYRYGKFNSKGELVKWLDEEV